MIGAIRNGRYFKFFWGVFALFLLNISIDNPDNIALNKHQDPTDSPDSFIELIVESALGNQNIIADFDDYDTDLQVKELALKKVKIHPENTMVFHQAEVPNQSNFPFVVCCLMIGFSSLNSPPPIILNC